MEKEGATESGGTPGAAARGTDFHNGNLGPSIKIAGGFWRLTDAHMKEVVSDYLNDRLPPFLSNIGFVTGIGWRRESYQTKVDFFSWYESAKKDLGWLEDLRLRIFFRRLV